MKGDSKTVKKDIIETDPIIYYENIKIDLRKDYRKILGISENDNQKQIVSVCRYALNNPCDEEMKNAANVLIDPEARRTYDIARKKIAMEKEEEEIKAARIEDAKTKAEKKKKKAERKRNAKLARENNRIERKRKRKEKNIAKNAENQKKRGYEKIVESYDSNITAAYARNTIKRSSSRRVVAIVIIGGIIGSSFVAGYINRDILKEKVTTIFDKDKNNEINYDESLNKVNASLNEETEVVEVRELEKEQYVKTFTYSSDENQVKKRSDALNNYFKANNFHDYIEKDLVNQIKYFDGSYQATEDGAFAMQDTILNLFYDFATTISANDTYINGVNEDGVLVGAGLDAFIADNSPNKEVVIETFENFKNLLTAKTDQERVEAANKFLCLEYQLKVGEKQNIYGEFIAFDTLEPNEGFVIGLLNYIGNSYCHNIVKENAQIPYTNKNNEQVLVNFKNIEDYYKLYYNNELNDDNPWVGYSMDLNNSAENLKTSYN